MKINATLAKQIADSGFTEQQIEDQIERFKKGFPHANIHLAASEANHGLVKLNEKTIKELVSAYESATESLSVVKFVPASGAASRMFKDLLAYFNANEGEKPNEVTTKFIASLKDFAFFQALSKYLDKPLLDKIDREESLTNQEIKTILSYTLTDKGLNLSNLPKGLVPFHKYNGHSRTPVHEHLIEGLSYSTGKGGVAKIHFTVSPEHLELFKKEVSECKTANPSLESIEVSYSVQDPRTNTLAVNLDFTPFIDNDKILFRPGGHGALINNLDQIDAELVFIKNIDNVVPDRLKHTTYTYKKALGGYLLSLRQDIKKYIEALDTQPEDVKIVDEIVVFLEEKLGKIIPKSLIGKQNELVQYLKERLKAPLRVCGMVKNEGEPGGGPFWVNEANGSKSLQILETAQIDLSVPANNEILARASYFNPVDLVCSTLDPYGQPYNLKDYVDPEAGFIVEKSKDGKKLLASELPGLWNGAMAFWNTIFVEVPVETFNPVKVINDLLREQHQ